MMGSTARRSIPTAAEDYVDLSVLADGDADPQEVAIKVVKNKERDPQIRYCCDDDCCDDNGWACSPSCVSEFRPFRDILFERGNRFSRPAAGGSAARISSGGSDE